MRVTDLHHFLRDVSLALKQLFDCPISIEVAMTNMYKLTNGEPYQTLQSNHDVDILSCHHEDVIKWKHFPRHWPFVRGIHRPPENSPHKCQWRGTLMFSLTCAWINGWVNNGEAGDLRRHHAHYDVTVMMLPNMSQTRCRCRQSDSVYPLYWS